MGASGGQQQMVIVSRFGGFDNECGERRRHCDRGRRDGLRLRCNSLLGSPATLAKRERAADCGGLSLTVRAIRYLPDTAD
jgi:hypothetical protein